MNIVFLDIDGVLNCQSYFKQRECKGEDIDDKTLPILQKIAKDNNAIIVLTSTWRVLDKESESYQYLVNKLAKYDLSIYDHTPIMKHNRPLEIKTWLSEHEDIENWVSLDDDFDESEYINYDIGGHLIHTSFWSENDTDGLREWHIEEVSKIFNK